MDEKSPLGGEFSSIKEKGVTVSSNSLKSGGEGEIRTPGTLLTYTRFPIVLLRPARTPLHSVIDHRSKPNTCIAASKELQAKKSKCGQIVANFLVSGGISDICSHRYLLPSHCKGLRAKLAWARQPVGCSHPCVLCLSYCPCRSCRAALAVPLLPCCPCCCFGRVQKAAGKQGPPSVYRAGLAVQSNQCANAASRPCALCLSSRLRGGAFW